jgi:adenylate kinase family enzyme
MRRIHIVGTSGAGKTIFAASLTQRLMVPHVEIDALAWGPNWSETPREELRQHLAAALAGPSWVVDGNYGFLRDLVWSRADTVVWLDYSFPVVIGRALRRTARRILRHELLWSGNRETLRKALSRESIVLWSLKTFRRRRREYPTLFAGRPALTVVRLTSPTTARRWLESVHPVDARSN